MSHNDGDLDDILYGELELSSIQPISSTNNSSVDKPANTTNVIKQLQSVGDNSDCHTINQNLQISFLEAANQEIDRLSKENSILKEENTILQKNISSLYRTAVTTIKKLETSNNNNNRNKQPRNMENKRRKRHN